MAEWRCRGAQSLDLGYPNIVCFVFDDSIHGCAWVSCELVVTDLPTNAFYLVFGGYPIDRDAFALRSWFMEGGAATIQETWVQKT